MIADMAEHRRLVHITSGLVIAAGVALMVVRYLGVAPPGRGAEAAIGAVAFGGVVAAPGILATLAYRRDQPALLLPAAVVLVPLSFISFALVTLPLLIPAFLLVRVWARSGSGRRRLGASLLYAAATVALLVGAFVALFIHQDPRSWDVAADGTVTASTVEVTGGWGEAGESVEGYGTSDIVTYGEALVSLTLTGTAIAIGSLVRLD